MLRESDAGVAGGPSIIRPQTCNKHDLSEFFVNYAKFSSGCVMDMLGLSLNQNKLNIRATCFSS